MRERRPRSRCGHRASIPSNRSCNPKTRPGRPKTTSPKRRNMQRLETLPAAFRAETRRPCTTRAESVGSMFCRPAFPQLGKANLLVDLIRRTRPMSRNIHATARWHRGAPPAWTRHAAAPAIDEALAWLNELAPAAAKGRSRWRLTSTNTICCDVVPAGPSWLRLKGLVHLGHQATRNTCCRRVRPNGL